MDKKLIALGAKCELARRRFFYYAQLKNPKFYKNDREYLVQLCDALEAFMQSDKKLLVMNIPPRHGKTYTTTNFVEWLLGKNPELQIMLGSYNETLSTRSSKKIRNDIMETKGSLYKPVYSDVFPGVAIKRGDGAMNLWSLEGHNDNYLATSPTGTATGFGCRLMIIDDIIKNAEEAYNEDVKEKHWDWFCFTGDTEIKTTHGDVFIKDLRVGDEVITFNHDRNAFEAKPILRIGNRKSAIYKLEFENGTKIKCTGNHKFFTNRGYKSIEQILQSLWCTIKEGKTILFSDVQKQSPYRARCKDKVHDLWKGNPGWSKKQTDEILFCGVQKRLQGKKRRRQVCRLGKIEVRVKKRFLQMPKVWKYRAFTSASYRPQYEKQQRRQSDSALSIVPYRLSQITRLPASDIQRVYDIEVADNNNFIANGFLVHNCNTMLSRLEEGGKIILIMTRWASDDLAGKALNYFPAEQTVHINLKAVQDDGNMLCSDVLSAESCAEKKRLMGLDIWSANYQQEPIDLKGRLYTKFKTYSGELPQFKQIRSYTDTADEGADFLCSIVYGVTFNNEAYVLDVLYTDAPMEDTEPKTAAMLFNNGVNRAKIESNNGGRGFARSVRKLLADDYSSNQCVIKWFHQSKNKEARILSNATWVMEHIYYPENWKDRWPEYYEAMTRYQRQGKNKHDDAVDATTGICEDLAGNNGIRILR